MYNIVPATCPQIDTCLNYLGYAKDTVEEVKTELLNSFPIDTNLIKLLDKIISDINLSTELEEIRSANEKLRELAYNWKDESESFRDQLGGMEKERDAWESKYNDSQYDIRDLNKRVEDYESSIAELESTIYDLENQVEELSYAANSSRD